MCGVLRGNVAKVEVRSRDKVAHVKGGRHAAHLPRDDLDLDFIS